MMTALVAWSPGCGGSEPKVEVATTLPAPGAAVILAGLGDRFPIAGPERSCLERKLDADAPLRRRIGSRIVAPESAEYQSLQAMSAACVNSVTNAAAFALMESRKVHRQLTGSEQSCLTSEFAALPQEDIDRVLKDGVAVADGPVSAIEQKCQVK